MKIFNGNLRMSSNEYLFIQSVNGDTGCNGQRQMLKYVAQNYRCLWRYMFGYWWQGCVSSSSRCVTITSIMIPFPGWRTGKCFCFTICRWDFVVKNQKLSRRIFRHIKCNNLSLSRHGVICKYLFIYRCWGEKAKSSRILFIIFSIGEVIMSCKYWHS